MKYFNTSPAGEKHWWFAWFPVWAWRGNDLGLVWLEYVFRKRERGQSCAKYRYEI